MTSDPGSATAATQTVSVQLPSLDITWAQCTMSIPVTDGSSTATTKQLQAVWHLQLTRHCWHTESTANTAQRHPKASQSTIRRTVLAQKRAEGCMG